MNPHEELEDPPQTFSRERLEASLEFAAFKDGMKRILEVPKGVIDRKVIEMKAGSERIGNPKAPGRKAKKAKRRGASH